MLGDEGFASALSLVDAVDADIVDLRAAQKAFVEQRPCAIVEEADPASGDTFVRVKVTKPVPFPIRRALSHIIIDLRSALDQATNAAVYRAGRLKDGDLYFPFATSPVDCTARMTKRAIVPASLIPIFAAFEPWPTSADHKGGDDLLIGLSKLAGPTKHRTTVAACFNGNAIHFRHACSEGPVTYWGPPWDVGQQTLTLFTVHPGGSIDYLVNTPVRLAFSSPGPLAGESIHFVAREWAKAVRAIVAGLDEASTHLASA